MDVSAQILDWLWTGFASGRLWIPMIVILLIVFSFLRSSGASTGFFFDFSDSDGDCDGGGDGGD